MPTRAITEDIDLNSANVFLGDGIMLHVSFQIDVYGHVPSHTTMISQLANWTDIDDIWWYIHIITYYKDNLTDFWWYLLPYHIWDEDNASACFVMAKQPILPFSFDPCLRRWRPNTAKKSGLGPFFAAGLDQFKPGVLNVSLRWIACLSLILIFVSFLYTKHD